MNKKLHRHPSAKLTPKTLIHLLVESVDELSGLFVVAVTNDGNYEVHMDSELTSADLCSIAVLIQGMSYEALFGETDEEDENG